MVYSELSGYRFYQTLGNLYATPRAGMVFPNFDSGDVLYLTTTTEILFGKDTAAVSPWFNHVVRFHIFAANFVKNSMSSEGKSLPVDYLPAEQALRNAQTNNSKVVYAKLLARDRLAPTSGLA